MKRLVATVFGMLICLPAWAETWKDDFEGDLNLNRWQKLDFRGAIAAPNWNIIKGELVATVEGVFRDRREIKLGIVPVGNPAGQILPALAPMEIAEEDDLAAEVKLKAEPMVNVIPAEFFVFRSIGMVITKKDNPGSFYTITWFPIVGEDRGGINVGFLGAGPIGIPFIIDGIKSVPIQVKMGEWHKMGLIIRQRPFQVRVYWDNLLAKEFGAPIVGAKDDFFPIGAVGLWAGGHAFRAYFDDFVMAWGDSIKDLPLAVQPKSKLTTTWGKIKTKH